LQEPNEGGKFTQEKNFKHILMKRKGLFWILFMYLPRCWSFN